MSVAFFLLGFGIGAGALGPGLFWLAFQNVRLREWMGF